MSYTVEAYKNTGLNAVNIPESLEWLRSNYTATTFPALEILQNEGLNQVSIHGTWDEVKDIDYIVIGGECYSVDGAPVMTSVDVATLAIVEDPLTSEGGAGAIEYLDGITERHTVGDDTLYKYTDSDPLTAPMEPLQLVTGSMLFDNATDDNSLTAVESTIDLVALGAQFDSDGNFNGTGITFTDGSGETVTVPYTEGVSQANTARTNYHIEGAPNEYTRSPNTAQYDVSYDIVQKGLAGVRALGTESAIISQVQYPAGYETHSVPSGTDTAAAGMISVINGVDTEADSGLSLNPYGTVQNNRLLYGDYNKYGILSASGDRGEYLPEQIADADDTSPSVRVISDPRPDGKPYFRFKKYLSDTSFTGFFQSAIAGLQWKNVPLTYSQASGSYLTTQNFTNGAQEAASAYNYNQQSLANNLQYGTQKNVLSGFSSGIKAVTNFLSGDFSGFASGLEGMGSTALNQMELEANNENSTRRTEQQYKLARQKEMQAYGVGLNAVAPTVLFPFNANIIRDFIGNGVVPYRYKYSTDDVTRIDKLLTMYGYVDQVALTADVFNARQNFDYVRANGVSIGGNIPLWKKDLIASQLGAGVRVWHVKPSTSYYTNNPIRS